jgi:macrolide transport system ATP-binding/permease protein
MSVLSANDVIKSFGTHRVLDGVTLEVSPGHRLGLVGENGTGKSTLLRVLAGTIQPDGGTLTRTGDVGFLHQELPYPEHATVGWVVDDALAPIRSAQRRLDDLAGRLHHQPEDPTLLAAYGESLQWATDHDMWDADRRAGLVLAGVGLAGAPHDRTVGSLSGGERSRLGLAALLIRQPRALLLDEPTNHLDDDAIEFVEAHLAKLPGAVVLASHDRVFLDAVCTGILDLDPTRGRPTRYGGTYSDYLHAKSLQRRAWQEQYQTEQEQLAQLRSAVTTTARQVAPGRAMRDNDKAGYNRLGERVQSQVSRRVQNARRRLAELDRTQVRRPPRPLRFRAALTEGTALDGVAVSVRQVRIPGRLHIDHIDIPATGRLLVEGANGAGKSTLLSLLAARLPAPSGSVTHRRGLRVGLLEQDVPFVDPACTPRYLYGEVTPDSAIPLTELGLVAQRDMDRPVGQLSVGQRRRLALALLLADPPHVLLLDEPTNHISLALAEELQEAMRTAPGAVVAASHDRWLRRRWDGARLELAGGRILSTVESLAASAPAGR